MRRSIVLVSLPVIALVLFAVPSRLEGPVLVPISPGHGLSLVDMAALVPLLVFLAALGTSLVRRRATLECTIRERPWWTTAVSSGAGLGLGLLLASVFPFFWWWAIGATLLTLVLILSFLAATGHVRARPSPTDGSRKHTEPGREGSRPR